ncbi:hypothetical protein TNCV_3674921 [Trichonephila clavipes]|nr:hypothetical protein TNCV_3674921 [Trichonephila clavipes]
MGCELSINHCRPRTSPRSRYHYLVRCPISGYQSRQIPSAFRVLKISLDAPRYTKKGLPNSIKCFLLTRSLAAFAFAKATRLR